MYTSTGSKKIQTNLFISTLIYLHLFSSFYTLTFSYHAIFFPKSSSHPIDFSKPSKYNTELVQASSSVITKEPPIPVPV
ncbi:hypothetical protein L1887_15710 [Cichorium endivia]|nr:hypothetical protein L1887_15710 [Cichorium endivia]